MSKVPLSHVTGFQNLYGGGEAQKADKFHPEVHKRGGHPYQKVCLCSCINLRFFCSVFEDSFVPLEDRGTFVEFRAGMLNVSPIGRNCSQVYSPFLI